MKLSCAVIGRRHAQASHDNAMYVPEVQRSVAPDRSRLTTPRLYESPMIRDCMVLPVVTIWHMHLSRDAGVPSLEKRRKIGRNVPTRRPIEPSETLPSDDGCLILRSVEEYGYAPHETFEAFLVNRHRARSVHSGLDARSRAGAHMPDRRRPNGAHHRVGHDLEGEGRHV